MPTRGYAHRIDVRAPRERVWCALIEPALLVQWYGPEARVAPRANGSYRIRVDVEKVLIDLNVRRTGEPPPERIGLSEGVYPDARIGIPALE